MDVIHIAELTPELASRDTKHFKAVVNLIWPYSSSQREFALLLAEPDFRLRRKNVRVRFTGSSAKALATTGVGIGDEVVLSLSGAQFVQEGAVSTPGRSIAWELEYSQTVIVQVYRNGSEIANLDIVRVAPTPAPGSPVRREPVGSPTPAKQWSSPAFLKRARLSDGPVLEAPYDPVADEVAEGHDKKRRRKSYRDWTAWTYNARTPSPEKDDVSVEDDADDMGPTPSQPALLPRTPISPPKPMTMSIAAGPLATDLEDRHQTTEKTEAVANPVPTRNDDIVRDADYYDLYADPDEVQPADAEYAFGGDTEANTDDEDDMEDTDGASLSATEMNTEDLGDDLQSRYESEHEETRSIASQGEVRGEEVGILENILPEDSEDSEDSLAEAIRSRRARASTADAAGDVSGGPFMDDDIFDPPRTSATAMPPPTLPALNTHLPESFSVAITSPTNASVQPLDSALSSPISGGRDVNASSHLEHSATGQRPMEPELTITEQQELPAEADYILESSFFNSIGSSRTPAFHPDHETAFTPVRFAFGMDGAASFRGMDFSSPVLEKESYARTEECPEAEVAVEPEESATVRSDTRAASLEDAIEDCAPSLTSSSRGLVEVPTSLSQDDTIMIADEPEVIELSSGSEMEDPEESEGEKDDMTNVDTTMDDIGDEELDESSESEHTESSEQSEDDFEEDDGTSVHQKSPVPNHGGPTSTNQSAAVSEIVDLGSPPDDSSDMEELTPGSPDAVTIAEDSEDVYGSRVMNQEPVLPLPVAASQSPVASSHSELLAMGFAPSTPSVTTNIHKKPVTHTPVQQVPESEYNPPRFADNFHSQRDVSGPDAYMQDGELMEVATPDAERDMQWTGGECPDVKMESIEDDSIFVDQLAHTDTVSGPSVVLIAVPEEGHKLGELHTISVPAAGPARNTRSKTKTSLSSTKEDTPDIYRTTRSLRSKTSVISGARATVSPPAARTRSIFSSAHEDTQTSPYSLRSQSKLLSPAKSISFAAPTTRQSPRKHGKQESVKSLTGLDDVDPILTSFMPSQDLGDSQGRHSNVSFIKDSEEESIHSEHSISTVRYSDDWNTFTNLSDSVLQNEQDRDTADLKPPPATAPEPRTTAKSKRTWKRFEPQVVIPKSSPDRPDYSLITQAPPSSPTRKLRSAGSTEVASPSPRVVRTTRHQVYSISLSPPVDRQSTTSKAKRTHAVVTSPRESENDDLRSSPPASATTLSNRPLTPNATQRTTSDSQPSFPNIRLQQTLPLTPQLTQTTSGLRSFKQSRSTMASQNTIPETLAKSSPVTKSTPRRNATETDVASPSTSPAEYSRDASSDLETTLVDKPETPSIGFSTPLAYYTPLNSLTYFLNRSSQFHTASSPDILALVTSGTTTPTRATKGPKHWNTTLSITDASTWPSTPTTVNIFRAYQTALPQADAGDVILLRAFAVKSLNRHSMLVSADESAWCVWRYGKPVWGAKRGAWGKLKAREEMRGPGVERGEGEWKEVERLRGWWVRRVKDEVEEREEAKVHTRSHDKGTEHGSSGGGEESASQVRTRRRDKGKQAVRGNAEPK
jgi:hypothetical protein